MFAASLNEDEEIIYRFSLAPCHGAFVWNSHILRFCIILHFLYAKCLTNPIAQSHSVITSVRKAKVWIFRRLARHVPIPCYFAWNHRFYRKANHKKEKSSEPRAEGYFLNRGGSKKSLAQAFGFKKKGKIMSKLGKQYVAPILIIVVGIGWLLNVQGIIPKVDWIWTCALAAVGILTLAVGGFDKLTVVVGPFLLVSSICSLLRQLDKLSVEKEIPILIIALGALLLLVHVIKLPVPEVLKEQETK